MTTQRAIIRVYSEFLSLVVVADGLQCHIGAFPSLADAFAANDPGIHEAFFAAYQWGRKPRKSPPPGWVVLDVGQAVRLVAGVAPGTAVH